MVKKEKPCPPLWTDIARPPVHRFVHPIHLPVVARLHHHGLSTGPAYPLVFFIQSHDEVKKTCRTEFIKVNVVHIVSCVISSHTVYRETAQCSPPLGE